MEELQRKGTRGSLLVAMVVVMVTSHGGVLAELTVSPHSEYCSQQPTFLSCDFKGAQEVVLLESLPTRGGKTVNTVYIHNAEQVVVADICASFVWFSVANITFNTIPEACTPGQQFSFKMADSSTNLVPPYVTQLDMQNSVAKDVILTMDLKKISVINSYIGDLEVSQPTKQLSIKVEHSVINNLEKLHLEGESYLVFYNVTINGMKPNSLHLKESTANIWESTIKTSVEQAIALGYKSKVILADMDGKVSLAGPEKEPNVPVQAAPPTEERRPPGVPTQTPQMVKPPPCNRPSILIWVIPMALATIEAIVIIINCTNWFPALKGRRVPHGLEEGQDALRQRQPEVTSYSTWYYNSELPMMSTTRRQNMGIDKHK